MSIFDLSEQEIIRRNSLNELRNDEPPHNGQGFVYGNSGQQGPHSSVC